MLLAALLGLSAIQEPVRPHDPWVFRAVFEDRPRQLVIALGSVGDKKPLWMVYHPETGVARKVWRGQVDYRGKVYDFSQENSRAEGDILAAVPDQLLSLPNDASDGWTLDGIRAQDGWRFEKDGATMMSPSLSNKDWLKTYISFDEFGDKGRIQFRLVDELGKSYQDFQSSTSGLGANSWQWNYKLLKPQENPFRIQISVPKAADGKRLRNLRVFGDLPAWFGRTGVLPVSFWGYQTDGTRSVVVKSRVGATLVDWSPEVRAGGWIERFTLKGVPEGGLTLLRASESDQVTAKPGELTDATGNHSVHFPGDGTYTLEFKG